MEKQQNEIFFETKDLTKKFGDVTAVNHVSMAIRTGEIRGLIGENGSGKSTISSMISAIHTVTGGEMFLYGKPYSPKNPGDARKCGITMIVQEAGTIDGLSIAENIFVGDEKRFAHHGIIDRAEMNREAVKALEHFVHSVFGFSCDLEKIRQDIEDRDYRDMHRETSPLKQAEDAVLVDTSDMTIEQVIDRIVALIG